MTALVAGGLLVASGGVAQADNAVAEGDGVVPVGSNTMAFGAIPCSVMQSNNALVAISRNGSATGTNTFRNSATVTVTVVSARG